MVPELVGHLLLMFDNTAFRCTKRILNGSKHCTWNGSTTKIRLNTGGGEGRGGKCACVWFSVRAWLKLDVWYVCVCVWVQGMWGERTRATLRKVDRTTLGAHCDWCQDCWANENNSPAPISVCARLCVCMRAKRQRKAQRCDYVRQRRRRCRSAYVRECATITQPGLYGRWDGQDRNTHTQTHAHTCDKTAAFNCN